MPKTLNLFSSADMSILPEILLDDISTINKVGSITFTGDISIGDFDINPLDIKKGNYNAYRLDDNLMIILDNIDFMDGSTFVQKKKNLSSIVWKKYKYSVPVDSGSFGFYDTKKVIKLNKITGSRRENSLPYINWSTTKKNTLHSAFIVDTSMIDRSFISNKSADIPDFIYGVVASSGTGDGIFDVYTHGKNMAIILGGRTMIKLYENNGMLDKMPGNLTVFRNYMRKN